MRLPTVIYSIIATVFIWVAVAMVRLIGGPDVGMLDFALFAGLGATVALWLVWAFVAMDAAKNAAQRAQEQQKAKRAPSGDEDPRLSVLLSLLDDSERRTLKDRLRDELSSDGEAIALDDLFEDRPRRR